MIGLIIKCDECGESITPTPRSTDLGVIGNDRASEVTVHAGPGCYPDAKDEPMYNTPHHEKLIAMLADEIADVILYADLLARHYGINVSDAVRAKFNRVSEAQGFPERL